MLLVFLRIAETFRNVVWIVTGLDHYLMAEKKGPVQDVRNVTLEEKLDKLIGLITLQNKTNENVLQNSHGNSCIIDLDEYKSQELLLVNNSLLCRGSGSSARRASYS